MKTKENLTANNTIFISDKIVIGNESEWKNSRKSCDVYRICDDAYVFFGILELIEANSSKTINVHFKTHSKYIKLGEIDYVFAQPMHIDKDVLGAYIVIKLSECILDIYRGNKEPDYVYRDIEIYDDGCCSYTYNVYTKKINEDPVIYVIKDDSFYNVYDEDSELIDTFIHNGNPFTDKIIMKRIYKFAKQAERRILKELEEYEV